MKSNAKRRFKRAKDMTKAAVANAIFRSEVKRFYWNQLLQKAISEK